MRIDDEKEGTDSVAFYSHKVLEEASADDFFKLLVKYDKLECVVGAGSRGKDNTQSEGRPDDKDGGIVPGHAYSIIKAKKIWQTQAAMLKKPWGSFEWKGDWSDDSKLWDQNPIRKVGA